MTSSGAPKSGPPAHQNRYAFQHNRASRLTQRILALPIHSLCPLCTRLIQWRKQFRKYKPLTVPKRCCRCQEKTVRDAYHVICGKCAAGGVDGGVGQCAKCLESRALDDQKRQLIAKDEADGKSAEVAGEDEGGLSE